MQLSELFSLVLKQGIRKYKFKNSKVRPIDYVPEGQKGAIFVFRSKELMSKGIGVVMSSEEALADNQHDLTHWTPNVFSYGTYTADNKLIVKGHEERNLKQINTFMIDIDLKPGQQLSEGEIIDHCINTDFGFLPTMILKTPGGYQVFFVLETPWFVSKKDNYASIKAAKHVSKNIRDYFAKAFPVDVGCNHFGITRIPREDNVVMHQPNLVYDMHDLLAWSKEYSPIKAKQKRPVLRVLSNQKRGQVDEPWVDYLLKNPEIQGQKGVLGRNNTIFTLALAFFSSGLDYQECYNQLDEFNSGLKAGLTAAEFNKIIDSAYSGKYQAANRHYVRELMTNWTSESLSDTQLFGENPKGWYKFKKAREDRKNSHYVEWKADLQAYLHEKSYVYKPYVYTSKKEIAADLSIPSRSLDQVLKQMHAAGEIFFRSKRGRGGGITIATREALLKTLILVKREVQEAFRESILTQFPEAARLVQEIFQPAEKREIAAMQLDLELRDTS